MGTSAQAKETGGIEPFSGTRPRLSTPDFGALTAKALQTAHIRDRQAPTEKVDKPALSYADHADIHFDRLFHLLNKKDLKGATDGNWQTLFDDYLTKVLKDTFKTLKDFSLVKDIFSEQFLAKSHAEAVKKLKKSGENPVAVAVASLLSAEGFEGELNEAQTKVKNAVELVLLGALFAYVKEEISEEKSNFDKETVRSAITEACEATIEMWLVLANLEENNLLTEPEAKKSRLPRPRLPMRYNGIKFGNEHGLKGGILDQLVVASKEASTSETTLKELLNQWKLAIAAGDRLTLEGALYEHKIITLIASGLITVGAMALFNFGLFDTAEAAPKNTNVQGNGARWSSGITYNGEVLNVNGAGTTNGSSAGRESTTGESVISYVVEPGDSISLIASRYGVDMFRLAEFNGYTPVMTDSGWHVLIHPGDVLNIPNDTAPVPTAEAAVVVEVPATAVPAAPEVVADQQVWYEAGTQYDPTIYKFRNEIIDVSLTHNVDPDLAALIFNFSPQLLAELKSYSDTSKPNNVEGLRAFLNKEIKMMSHLPKDASFPILVASYLDQRGELEPGRLPVTIEGIDLVFSSWSYSYKPLISLILEGEITPIWESSASTRSLKTMSGLGIQTQTESGKNRELAKREDGDGLPSWLLGISALGAATATAGSVGYGAYHFSKKRRKLNPTTRVTPASHW
jgi:hypothetical protein